MMFLTPEYLAINLIVVILTYSLTRLYDKMMFQDPYSVLERTTKKDLEILQLKNQYDVLVLKNIENQEQIKLLEESKTKLEIEVEEQEKQFKEHIKKYSEKL